MNPVAGTSDDAANEGPSHPVLSTSIGDSVEVSIQFFLDHILPPLHTAIDTDRVVRRLKRKGKNSYRPITLLNRWRGFSKDPALEQRPDDQSFNQLVSVAHAITKACPIKGVTPRYTFNNNQHGCPSASERNAGSFPDGYLLSSERASHPEFGWADIVVAGEYRKKGSAVDERYNMAKVCWSMSNLMQEDPRRRFVFAFTIENTNMTLWFCNRSQIVKSESFNFILEHKTLVHFFLSFIYAEPHQAGFDPTMEARYNEGLFYYDITVRSSDGEKFVYRTLDKISESGAAMILGRGTRVWKAIETKSGEPHGEPVVLKESWVDTDRMREGAVHQAIRDTNYSELDRWLLTVQCHGDVFIGGNTENEQVDLTLAIIKHSYTRQSRYGTRSAAVLEHEMVYNPQPHPRVHYRIVFKEVCKPMRGLSLHFSSPHTVLSL